MSSHKLAALCAASCGVMRTSHDPSTVSSCSSVLIASCIRPNSSSFLASIVFVSTHDNGVSIVSSGVHIVIFSGVHSVSVLGVYGGSTHAIDIFINASPDLIMSCGQKLCSGFVFVLAAILIVAKPTHKRSVAEAASFIMCVFAIGVIYVL